MSVSIQRGTITGNEPITVDEAKLHLRVDGADDDKFIGSLITAARERAELITGRSLIKSSWTYSLDAFPCGISDSYPAPARTTSDKLVSAWANWQVIELPRAPLVSVDFVSYVADASGLYATLDQSRYAVDKSSEPARLFPVVNSYWPTSQAVPGAVQIGFTAGYDAVPQSIRVAMLLMIGNWYAQREDVADIPRATEYLLSSYRVQPFGLTGAY